ncbi:MAG TPA: TIGR04282 family arsenosugar biosynthesis glycosyltransferase [Candidatus Polarisedimenticolia bacterium]|nr:TIGR04282 family arsenosugar biosynthesis glycosyltransferase [Candidatus Polarisedimenticolia bacterium]
MSDAAIALFAKAPVAGRVKTRLVPPLTHEDAARVARASLEDTARRIAAAVSVPWTLFLDGEPDESTRRLADETGIGLLPQEGDGLGSRLTAAFRVMRSRGARRVLAIGSDSPTLDPERIREAIESLAVCELTLGPTEDGGYYLIGMSGAHESVFEEIPWGSADTAAATLDRARTKGLSVRLLSPWYDLDDTQDLVRAYQAMSSRWALREVLEGLKEKLSLVSRPASDSPSPA